MFRDLDRHRRVLLCHPSQRDAIRDAVERLPFECFPGLIQVRSTELVQPGQVIVCDPNPPQLPPPSLSSGRPLRCIECRGIRGHTMNCSQRPRMAT